MPSPNRPLLVVEDDPFTRLAQVILDPATSEERRAAFADYFSHDLPDFDGWCAHVRSRAPALAGADVRLVYSPEELRAAIGEAQIVIVEGFPIGETELAAAHKLVAVQKFGMLLRNIDTDACARRGVKVLTLRRRANVACAEQVMALMMLLAKKLHQVGGLVTPKQMAAAGYPLRPFDRRHTPNSNYGRIPGVRMLQEATIGIVGLGEIGREVAQRAASFEMHILYHQRTRLPEAEERSLRATYVPLDRLMAESDWIVPQMPGGPATRHLISADMLAKAKPGACIVNVARADLVDRAALIAALKSGRIGGFALDPLYEEPAREDDELLRFDNVVLTPHMAAQPRFNAMRDLEDLVVGMADAIGRR